MACFADADSLKPIIEAGADLSIKDKQGQTAAELASRYGNKAKADLLDAAMNGQPTPLAIPQRD